MASKSTAPLPSQIDGRYLESLVGYNARRAALVIVDAFIKEMLEFDLRPTDFSVLSLVAHNPGITSSQLCSALSIQPPNLVGIVGSFEKRELLSRKPHPLDGRAIGLHLTTNGKSLMQKAQRRANRLEASATQNLSATERKTLMKLLQKIYQ